MVACIYRSADLFGVPEEPITKAESEFGGGQQQEEHQLPRHHQQQETALNDKIDARLERVNESEEVAEDSRFWQVCSYAFVSGCVRACFVCYVFPRVQVKSSVFSMSFSPFKSMCRCIFSLRAHT